MKVSVIIPTYRGTGVLGEAIRSVLTQTYVDFELIVVDDASPDETAAVVRQFDDPRLIYLTHERNQGAIVARQTALRASSGELIALLDQDDLFHAEKLATHVQYMMQHPEIGVSYNGRFDFDSSPERIRAIWQPPSEVSLADCVLGFPFAPSDTVFRRQWVLRKDIWETITLPGEERIVNGGEYVYCGRLFLAGCRFGNVGRALNYRRYHPLRVYSDLAQRCRSELECQRIIFDDPRCSAEVRALRDEAYSNTYLVWSFYAFAQEENETGSSYVKEAISLRPSIVAGYPCHLADFMIENAILDQARNPEVFLRQFFAHLPQDASRLVEHTHEAVASAWLLKGALDILWGRLETGEVELTRAADWGAAVNDAFLNKLTYQLLLYENELGAHALHVVARRLALFLDRHFGAGCGRRVYGSYAVNRAFQSYRHRQFTQVPPRVARAVANRPAYLLNRGVWSIFIRSMASALPAWSVNSR